MATTEFDSAEAVKFWLSEQFAVETNPQAILALVSEALGRFLRISRVGYGEIAEHEDVITIVHDWTDGLPSVAGRQPLYRGAELVREYARGRTLVVPDADAMTLADEERRWLAASHTRAFVAVPLIHDGRFVALFAVNHHRPRDWTADEVALVAQTGARLWAALEHARTIAQLRESEERFRLLAENMPGICWLADADGHAQWMNRAGEASYGAIGGDPAERVHPDDRAAAVELQRESLLSGRPFEMTLRMRVQGGGYRTMLTRTMPVRDADGAVMRWCGLQFDVSEQHARSRHDSFARALADAIRDATDPAAILDLVADMLRSHLDVARVIYREALSDSDTSAFDLRREVADILPDVSGVHGCSLCSDDLLATFSRGETVVSDDLAQLGGPIDARVREYLAAVGARSCVGVPLVKAGGLDGVLVVQHDAPRRWQRNEIALVEEVAERTWSTLNRARAEATLKARERDQTFLIAWADRMRTARDEAMIVDVTLSMLGEHLGASAATCATMTIDPAAPKEESFYRIIAEWNPAGPRVLGSSFPASNLSDFVRQAYLAGRTMVSNDLANDMRFSEEARRRFAENGVRGRLGVPLARGDIVQAILAIDQDRPRAWQPSEVALAGEVAERMWSILERARAEAALQQRERDQAFLLDWSDAVRGLTGPDAIMHETLARLGRHLDAARVTFSEAADRVFTTRWNWCAGPRQASLVGLQVALDAVGPAIEREWLAGVIVRYDDVTIDPRISPNDRETYAARQIGAFVSLPLIRNGNVVAILSVQSETPRTWADREITLMRDAAERTWNTLERARAQEALQQRERDQAFLLDWSDELRRTASAEQVLSLTLERLTRYLGGTRTTYSVGTAEPGEFVVIDDWCDGVQSVVGARFSTANVSQPILKQWLAGHIVRYDDVVGDPRVLPGREGYYAEIEVRAFITVPLIVDGEMRGSISVQSVHPRAWRETEIQLIRDISERLWIVLDRAAALADLRQRERDQAFLIEWSDAVREEAGAPAILAVTLDRVSRYLSVDRGTCAEADESGAALVVLSDYAAPGCGERHVGRRFAMTEMGERLMAEHLTGQPVVMTDTMTDLRLDSANRALFAALDIRATASIPLVRAGRLEAVFSVQQAAPRDWRASEIRLLRDVADRTWAVLERARSEERLNQSEAQLSAFLQNAPVAMHLKDASGRYVRVNPQFATAVGRDYEEVQGLRAGDLFPPAVASKLEALAAGAFAGRVAADEFDTGRQGAYQSVLSISFPIEGTTGPARIGGFTIDLTERKRAEAALARSREALFQAEKLSALGALLAGVSHELNNPLSIVVAQAVMMERQGKGTELAERAVKIRRAADRCARIVQTFLAMARQKAPERHPVDLAAVAVAALDLTEYGLRSEGIEVVRDFAVDLPRIAADADQLHQIIINLLINAQHALAGHPAERRVTIRTAPGPEPMTVVLDVADTGPGVPDEVRRRIFEPFFTTKAQGEGTGVGLSFSQGLAEAHGGRLTLLPEKRGAIFRLTLPVEPEHTLPLVEPETAVASAAPARRALVVDDEAEIAEALADFLSLEGFSCEIAIGGVAARARLAEGNYDLIVSDLRMADLDGPALYEFVRASRPELVDRMAFATGDTLGASAARFIAEARRPVLEKPFVPEAVRRFLSQMEQA